MKRGGKGGGSTITGIRFETRIDLKKALGSFNNYKVRGDILYYKGQKVAEFYKKYDLYKNLLKPKGIDYSKIISKRLIPDEAILILKDNILYVIEIKFQEGSGSVDEKLQTCDFKKRQYSKLVAPLGISVEFTYILCDWFKDKSYKDTLDYVQSVGCHYFFNELPLNFLGLPLPKS